MSDVPSPTRPSEDRLTAYAGRVIGLNLRAIRASAIATDGTLLAQARRSGSVPLIRARERPDYLGRRTVDPPSSPVLAPVLVSSALCADAAVRRVLSASPPGWAQAKKDWPLMTPANLSESDVGQRVRDAILEATHDGTVLMGTLTSLAYGLGSTVAEFRSGLRELLEAERIVVGTEPRGHLTVRGERRTYRSVTPALERRHVKSDHWTL